jgi:hypothetical protein
MIIYSKSMLNFSDLDFFDNYNIEKKLSIFFNAFRYIEIIQKKYKNIFLILNIINLIKDMRKIRKLLIPSVVYLDEAFLSLSFSRFWEVLLNATQIIFAGEELKNVFAVKFPKLTLLEDFRSRYCAEYALECYPEVNFVDIDLSFIDNLYKYINLVINNQIKDINTLKNLNKLYRNDDYIYYYTQTWRYSFRRRRPEPGFHPGIYAEARALPMGVDPLAHYIRSQSPPGPWFYPLLPLPRQSPKARSTLKTALHIHAFNPEILWRIFQRISRNSARPDIFLSVNSPTSLNNALSLACYYQLNIKEAQIVENVGRDYMPLLTVFGERLVADYELIGHAHTKKSAHNFRYKADKWSFFLYESLLGGAKAGAAMDQIIRAFQREPRLGLVFPDDPHVFGWEKNWESAQYWARALGIETLPHNFNFPVGSMCWLRRDLLKALVDLRLTPRDYPPEPLPVDGTILHALERILGILPDKLGFYTKSIYIKGISR